ncbi:Sporulation protein YdcC [compost metagenome]
MRRITWMLAIVICLTVVVAGCGKKDAGSVVKDLEHVVGKLDSYQGEGRMVLQTGSQPQEYQVEVWYLNPNFYRISLTNEQKDITQIVLRNEEGVFVLTPHLKKSFRFQSDWPDNQGQVYLYQSLVQSILKDKERQFTTDNEAYVFDVMANYQNELLQRQKIWLNKKSLAPQHVEVSDTNQNVLVKVDFTTFEFGKKFEKEAFGMEHNMTSWNMQTLPTLANADGTIPNDATKSVANKDAGTKGVKDAATSTSGKDGTSVKATETKQGTAAKPASFGVIEPSYIPKDVVKQDITEMKLGEDPAVLLRYKGKYNYSLLEVRPQSKTVSMLPGDIVDLGYTLGVLTGEEKKTLTWTYDGVEYRLSTADLPMSEMMQIAQAVQGQSGK